MFLQVACIVDEDELISRREVGLFVGCLAVFVALGMSNYIDYIKRTQENSYVEWDVKTITAGDYAIEFAIDENFFKDYLATEHMKWCEKSRIVNNRIFLSRVQAF